MRSGGLRRHPAMAGSCWVASTLEARFLGGPGIVALPVRAAPKAFHNEVAALHARYGQMPPMAPPRGVAPSSSLALLVLHQRRAAVREVGVAGET